MPVLGVLENGMGTVPYVVATVIVAILLLFWKGKTFYDPRVPPLMYSRIPFIGHALGIFRYKMDYFEMVSSKHQLPIFALPIFHINVYIAASPHVVQSALCAKNLSFDPFSIAFTENILGMADHVRQAVMYFPENDKEVCYVTEIHKVYHEPLSPGPELQHINRQVLRKIAETINEIKPEFQPRNLYLWLQDLFTIAVAYSLFGPRNPIALDPSLIERLWEFETGIPLLMVNFMPNFIARKQYKARNALQSAFRAYFHASYDLDDDVSPFIKRYTAVHKKYGFTNDDVGGFSIAMLLAATTNAMPTLFWFMVHILSDPELIEELRSELVDSIRTTYERGQKSIVIDTAKFQEHCPLLISAYQEAMRFENAQLGIRVASADTVLTSADGTYLIKKNSVIILPSGLLHTSTDVWGPDARTFNARRWLKRDAATNDNNPDLAKDMEKLQKKAFFPFGGGRHLCPGRHLAFIEILGMISIIVLGFDVVLADGEGGGPGGPVKVPKAQRRVFGQALPKPAGDTNVFIKRKDGFENVRWSFAT